MNKGWDWGWLSMKDGGIGTEFMCDDYYFSSYTAWRMNDLKVNAHQKPVSFSTLTSCHHPATIPRHNIVIMRINLSTSD